jgi:TnpA family transposase
VYLLDGLLTNLSTRQPHTLCADTHGPADPVFGLAALVGLTLLPRMRTWNDATCYRVDHTTTSTHIEALCTPGVDWAVIARHWDDRMPGVLAMHAGTVLPSMLLQTLGVYSRQSSL